MVSTPRRSIALRTATYVIINTVNKCSYLGFLTVFKRVVIS